MCDYSLEMYASRPAREGETFVTSRFPSGTIGVVDPKDCTTAICLTYGAKMTVSNISDDAMSAFGVTSTENVEFVRAEGLHHDAIKFENGQVINLQRLGTRVTITFTAVAPPVIVELLDATDSTKELPVEITDLLTVNPRDLVAF